MPRLPYRIIDCSLISDIRFQSLLTQQEFASLMGVSEATVQNWENGRSNPLPKHVRKLVVIGKESGIGAERLIERSPQEKLQ
ncbi:MAG: helix-turn-helix domain-containing protein [Deltaproteobacteria bacterium]|nr:helix-turn-helix domain-containing protein [Deltaproteobacteria bacterium]